MRELFSDQFVCHAFVNDDFRRPSRHNRSLGWRSAVHDQVDQRPLPCDYLLQRLVGQDGSNLRRGQCRGQVTERYSKAIDQLGARGEKRQEKVDIRPGGIYALEQIAGDSPELHWPIVEILIAFIREHTKKDADVRAGAEEPKPDQTVALDIKVASDIQALG
jgi:hypothetical protein